MRNRKRFPRPSCAIINLLGKYLMFELLQVDRLLALTIRSKRECYSLFLVFLILFSKCIFYEYCMHYIER